MDDLKSYNKTGPYTENLTVPPATDLLAHVSGKNKAIRITTDAMGETIAIGSGTEPLATAAAALKDLEHILTARAGATHG